MEISGKLTKEQLLSSLKKARVLGILTEIPTHCGHRCYLIKEKYDKLLYIPDNVTKLNSIDDISEGIESDDQIRVTKYLKSANGNLKVIGGSNLKDAICLFIGCCFDTIDLSDFDTANIEDMSAMFYSCIANKLKIVTPKNNKNKSTNWMFAQSSIIEIDLSEFYTDSVVDMSGMFRYCETSQLDLSSFDTSNVIHMDEMFEGCKAREINVKSFNTLNVKYAKDMFGDLTIDCLDLSSFNLTNVYNLLDSSMFYSSQITRLIASSDICKCYEMWQRYI